MHFILEQDSACNLSPDVNTVRFLIDAENEWNAWNPNNTEPVHTFQRFTLDELKSNVLPSNGIPVGSIEFCNKVSERFGGTKIRAINIPEDIKSYCLRGQNIYHNISAGELQSIIANNGEVLVKPDDFAKRFETCAVSKSNIEAFVSEHEPPYFVTTKLQKHIVAEWRIFFYRWRIVGLAPYSLDKWVAPQQSVCMDILRAWTNAPKAGTLDVAVLENGQCAIIEMHPFIACGLYGFERREILPMLRDAWQWHISNSS